MVVRSALDPVHRFTSRTVIPTIFVLVKLFQKKSRRKPGKSLIHRLGTAQAIANLK
jgi:hypothetical protein